MVSGSRQRNSIAAAQAGQPQPHPDHRRHEQRRASPTTVRTASSARSDRLASAARVVGNSARPARRQVSTARCIGSRVLNSTMASSGTAKKSPKHRPGPPGVTATTAAPSPAARRPSPQPPRRTPLQHGVGRSSRRRRRRPSPGPAPCRGSPGRGRPRWSRAAPICSGRIGRALADQGRGGGVGREGVGEQQQQRSRGTRAAAAGRATCRQYCQVAAAEVLGRLTPLRAHAVERRAGTR